MVFYLYILSLAIYFIFLDYICYCNYNKEIGTDELNGGGGLVESEFEFERNEFHLNSMYGPEDIEKA
jgi:hypothetical protein